MGGVAENVPQFSKHYVMVWLIQALAYCAVDVYALISGFVGVKAEQKYANLVMLWLQGLTYSLLFAVIMFAAGVKVFNATELVKAFFPVLTGRWWYLTKYVMVFLFAPFINAGMKQIPQSKMRLILMLSGVLMVGSETFLRTSVFDTAGGYGIGWLVYLYAVGGYLSYYDIPKKVKPQIALIVWAGCTLTTWGFKMLVDQISFRIWGEVRYGMWLYTYVSPTVVGAAIMLVLVFASMKIEKSKIISTFAPATFGVFLIHTHTFLLKWLCTVLVGDISQGSWLLVLPKLLFGAMMVFLICGAVELVRLRIVKQLKIKAWLSKIEQRLVVRS